MFRGINNVFLELVSHSNKSPYVILAIFSLQGNVAPPDHPWDRSALPSVVVIMGHWAAAGEGKLCLQVPIYPPSQSVHKEKQGGKKKKKGKEPQLCAHMQVKTKVERLAWWRSG